MKRTAVGLAAVAALGVAALIPAVGQSQAPRTITLNAAHDGREGRGPATAGQELCRRALFMSTSSLRNAEGARVGTGNLSCNLTGRARTFESANFRVHRHAQAA